MAHRLSTNADIPYLGTLACSVLLSGAMNTTTLATLLGLTLLTGCNARLEDDRGDGALAANDGETKEAPPIATPGPPAAPGSNTPADAGPDSPPDAGTTWESRAALPSARTEHGVAAIDHTLYAFGGYDGATLARLDAYDPATDTWTTKAPMHHARRAFASAVIGGKLIVSGGMSFTDYNAVTYVNETESYDPTTNTWTDLAPCPITAASNAVWGNLFVGGSVANGAFQVLVFNSADSQAGGVNSKYTYDATNDSWTRTATGPFGGAQVQTTNIGSTLYVVASAFSMASGTTLWGVAPATDQWSPLAPHSLTWRSGVAAAGGQLFVLGGVSGTAAEHPVTADVYAYDPTLAQWSARAPLQVAREYPGAAVLDGHLYVLGGDVTTTGVAHGVPSAVVERIAVP